MRSTRLLQARLAAVLPTPPHGPSEESRRLLEVSGELARVERDGPIPLLDRCALVLSGLVRRAWREPERVDGFEGRGVFLGTAPALGLPGPELWFAHEPAELLLVNRLVLRSLTERDAGFALQLATEATRREVESSERSFARSELDAQGRLAERLLSLGRRFGVRDDRGVFINVRLPQRLLGELTGLSREAVSHALGALRASRAVHLEERRIFLQDLALLERMVEERRSRKRGASGEGGEG